MIEPAQLVAPTPRAQEETLTKKRTIIEYYLKKRILLSKEKILDLQSPTFVEQEFLRITQEQKTNYTITTTKEFFSDKENYTVADFTSFFLTRFKALERMLSSRQDLTNLTSIKRLAQKAERETVSIIGMVYDKGLTKNGNISMTLEDPTGFIKVIISKNSPAFAVAQDTSLDEVIGIVGSLGKDIIFANSIIYPDVPLLTEVKKSPDEAYIVNLSCVHVGSSLRNTPRKRTCKKSSIHSHHRRPR